MVAAVRSDRGASRQILLGAVNGKVEILVSVPLMIEYEAVLTRQEHLEASGLRSEDVNEMLDALSVIATPVYLRFLWRPQLTDPADEMVLETAVNGAADVLVTFNLKHFGRSASVFGIRTLLPRDAWMELRRTE